MTRFRFLALIVGAASILTVSTPVDAGQRAYNVRTLHNRARTTRSLSALEPNTNLSRLAYRHSVRMANQNRLHHARCLRCDVKGGWSALGENVGVGGSIEALHQAFMDSPDHRANILCRRFDQIGVGVVRKHGRIWVTVRFSGSSL